MRGINFEALANIVNASSIPVVVSGGVSSIFDIIELKERFANSVAGAICGRALCERALSPTAACAVLQD